MSADLQLTLNALPVLPPIRDPALEALAFEVPSGRFAEGSRHLEQLGDNILGFYCGRFLRARFPTLTIGDLQWLKSDMVFNRRFAEISIHYGLPNRLTSRGRPTYPRCLKDKADVFEAYVGAFATYAESTGDQDDYYVVIRFCADVINASVFSDLDARAADRYVRNDYPPSLRINPVSPTPNSLVQSQASISRLLLAKRDLFNQASPPYQSPEPSNSRPKIRSTSHAYTSAHLEPRTLEPTFLRSLTQDLDSPGPKPQSAPTQPTLEGVAVFGLTEAISMISIAMDCLSEETREQLEMNMVEDLIKIIEAEAEPV